MFVLLVVLTECRYRVHPGPKYLLSVIGARATSVAAPYPYLQRPTHLNPSQDRANELRAFVDVLTVVAADEREAAELRASERALREQLETVKADLQVIKCRLDPSAVCVCGWVGGN